MNDCHTSFPVNRLLKGMMLSCLSFSLLSPAVSLAESSEAHVAAQMYTLRDFGSLEEQLAAVERAGIDAVELVGDHGVEASEMNKLLAEYELEVVSSHVAIDSLRDDIDTVIDFSKAINNDTLVIPYLEESERPENLEGWQELGEEIGEMADRLAEEELRLAYHNHDFEMKTYDGKTAFEVLLDAAGPEVMGEVDLAWVARGGLNPADYLSRFEGRLFAVHVKDNAPTGTAQNEKGFAIPGQGVLKWQTILPEAQRAGAEWYIIEHDQPSDAQAVMTEGNRFLRDQIAELPGH